MKGTVENRAKDRIVIVGRNYGNILAMARAVGRAGYDVDVLRLYKSKPKAANLMAAMKPDACSRYVCRFKECIVGRDESKAVDALMSMNPDCKKRLLLPVDDYSCGIVDENLELLKSQYMVPEIVGRQGGIKEMMDKNKQKELADSIGLPILKSVLIKSEDHVYEIPEGTPFPCFIKPNISMNDTKARMTRCDNMEQLDFVLRRYADKGDFQLLAEEFAHIKDEYSLLGVSDGNTVIAPGLFRAEIGGSRERKGVAMTGITEDNEKFAPIIKKSCEYIKLIGYTGLFDIDIIETTDGHLYFIEVNFRAGASVHVFTEEGVNMPGIFADNIVRGIPIDSSLSLCSGGKRFLSEKILLEEFARNDVSRNELKGYLKNAEILFIKDEEDPEPYRNFKKYYFIAWLMRVPYRIRDRRKEKRC